MKDIKERVARVEEISGSAHKRLDKQEIEVEKLRVAKHDHAGHIQRHEGFIDSHGTILNGIEDAVRVLTKSVYRFETVALTAITMGGALISFLGFVGGKLLKWW